MEVFMSTDFKDFLGLVFLLWKYVGARSASNRTAPACWLATNGRENTLQNSNVVISQGLAFHAGR